jgi:hypothetical protein
MSHEIELNDEQLAQVAGGSSRTNISQLASSFTLQQNTVNAGTNVFAIGGGKNSSVEALAQGSSQTTSATPPSRSTAILLAKKYR